MILQDIVKDGRRLFPRHTADLDAHTRDERQVLRIGDHYYCGIYGYPSNVALVANTLYGMPFIVARDITVDRIAMEVQGAAGGGNVRLGIYNEGTNLYPGTLLVDAGTIDATSATLQPITIDEELTKGLYWLAFVSDNTPTMRARVDVWSILGFDDSSWANCAMGWTAAFSYAALPTPFTTGGSAKTGTIPLIGVRPSSLD